MRMSELRELVRSPNHLMVFEVAARHQSFTAAAKELNVTQPAISRSIRELESALGMPLFTRGYRSVELTDAGEILFHAVSAGFGRIRQTATWLHRRAMAHVTLLTSAAFASFCLAPRLSDFQARHPDIDLRLHVSDRILELAEENVSLGVRCGDGRWDGYDCALLAREEVFPVASPGFAATLANADDPGALAGEALIHIDEAFIPSRAWSEWFEEMEVDYVDEGKGLRLNDYVLVIQSAMAGAGIAMGWSVMVDHLIDQGLLVRVGRRRWQTERGFYLIWSNRAPLSRQAETVREWVIASVSNRTLPGR